MYVNKINKKLSNNERVYYGKKENTISIPGNNIYQKINKVFSSKNYIYKADLVIVTKDGEVKKRVIGKNNNYLITSSNELIPITDIIDIKYQ